MARVEIADLVVEYSRGDYVVRPLDGFSLTAEETDRVAGILEELGLVA